MHPATEHVLKFFAYDHLPERLKVISKPFGDLAKVVADAADNQETTVALRKLLEAKDAAVRAVLSLIVIIGLCQTAMAQPDRIEAIKANTEAIRAKPKAAKEDAYGNAYRNALATRKPLLVFVSATPRDVPGCVSTAVPSMNGSDRPRVIVMTDADAISPVLEPTATDAEILRAAGRQVSLPAYPFDRRPEPPTADDSGPWLPVGEQERIKAMWPEGVPFPKTLKFYKLRPASQRVAAFGTSGAGNSRRFVPPSFGDVNPNREFPWIGSGGMDFAKSGTWENVTGLAIPEGAKILWWLAPMPLVNSSKGIQYEWAMHWEFPTGTQAFDGLIRLRDDGGKHFFTIRRRIKNASGWDDGTVFAPDVPTGQEWAYPSSGNIRTKSILGIDKIVYRVADVGKVPDRVKFKETKLAMDDDGHFFPLWFKGAGLSCNKCHSGGAHESREYGGPLLRGKDTVFSWYPIPENLITDSESWDPAMESLLFQPPVDSRWPIEKKQGSPVPTG